MYSKKRRTDEEGEIMFFLTRGEHKFLLLDSQENHSSLNYSNAHLSMQCRSIV